jgi:hypothetical protein
MIKKIQYTAIAVAIISWILKVAFFLPYTNLFITLSFLTLAILYFGFTKKIVGEPSLKYLTIYTSIIMGASIIGVLFKILIWPNGSMMILIPLILLISPVILLFSKMYISKEPPQEGIKKYRGWIMIVLYVVLMQIMFALLESPISRYAFIYFEIVLFILLTLYVMYMRFFNETESLTRQVGNYKLLTHVVIVGVLISICYLIPSKSLIRFYWRNNPEYIELRTLHFENPTDTVLMKEVFNYEKTNHINR